MDEKQKRKEGKIQMEYNAVTKRELYIDVVVSELEAEELYLYQVDFTSEETFRTKEYLFKTPGEEETEEMPDLLEQFYEQFTLLMQGNLPTEIFATDDAAVMAYVIEPLQKRYPEAKLFPINEGLEPIHDCISMVRVVPMTTFDERQYLSSMIRRRMKEKYHAVAENVKRETTKHLFLLQKGTPEYPSSIKVFVTDQSMQVEKEYTLLSKVSEETIATRLYEILQKYPEADILVDGVNRELYRSLHNMTMFMNYSLPSITVYSLQSMLRALGKNVEDVLEAVRKEHGREQEDVSVWITVYQEYIKNIEALRFERFEDENIYRIHRFFLPVRLSSTAGFQRLMKNNSVWKLVEGSGNTYQLKPENEELKAKYIITAGEEQFVLRVTDISCTRYLNNYAVLNITTENHFYPGNIDCDRINELGSYLYTAEAGKNSIVPTQLDMKLKLQGKTYTLTTARSSNEDKAKELWLSGLFLLGQKKQGKKELVFADTSAEKMLVIDGMYSDKAYRMEGIDTALLKNECYHRIEEKLALVAAPKKAGMRPGKLTHRQKMQIRQLFEYFRYLRTSFGTEWETGTDTREMDLIDGLLHTTKTAERLEHKFSLY